MGSFVAQRVASIAPQRLDRLVLVATAPTPQLAAIEELQGAVGDLADPVPEDFVREFQASTIHRPIPEAFFERVVVESLKLPARVWQATTAAWLTEHRWADPARLTMPVLILWGDRDEVTPRGEQDQLVATLPDAAFTVYPETGHALHWEQPERFVHDLEAFLSET
jgi:pimeloyl-ACP methyl ester carboxylesterase